MLKTRVVVAAVLLLVACGVPKPRDTPPRATPEAVASSVPFADGNFRIDATRSEVRLLVYRAGALARLGHNHVIVNNAVSGWVAFSGDVSKASFSLSIPVAEFVVDEARSRREEGVDFSAAVPDDARLGTRHNMLGAGLLNGEDFPLITLTSVAVEPAGLGSMSPGSGTSGAATSGAAALMASMMLRVAGHESMLVVPFTLEISAGHLSASGSVALRQTAIGLVPFSLMLGALQVQDEFTVKFKLFAANSSRGG